MVGTMKTRYFLRKCAPEQEVSKVTTATANGKLQTSPDEGVESDHGHIEPYREAPLHFLRMVSEQPPLRRSRVRGKTTTTTATTMRRYSRSHMVSESD